LGVCLKPVTHKNSIYLEILRTKLKNT